MAHTFGLFYRLGDHLVFEGNAHSKVIYVCIFPACHKDVSARARAVLKE
jgi:hypothetical protein